jgi:D-amino peptidase
MEGIATTAIFDDCIKTFPQYPYHCEQMTREVAAVCAGALDAGATEIVVKDAHGPASNIDPKLLPDHCQIIRKWSGHPYLAVEGLDPSFDAILFVGYHCGASADGNPLAHTISLRFRCVHINGSLASEFSIFSACADREGVPVVYLSGDKQICAAGTQAYPHLVTTVVKEGFGSAIRALSTTEAVRRLRADAAQALRQLPPRQIRPLPEHFLVELAYHNPFDAYRCSFYPGARLTESDTVVFAADDYFDVLRFFNFIVL